MADFIDMRPLSAPVAAALAARLRGEAAAWPELSDEDYAALLEHGMLPLAYALTRAEALREEATHGAVVEALRLAGLRTLLDALGAAGVTPLILKGTALAYSLYASPELRPRGDTDLLISLAELPAVRALLQSLGYEERPTSGDELAIRQAAFHRTDTHGVAHVYDVHWAIANNALFAEALSVEELHAAALPLSRVSPHARTLPCAEALLVACLHRVAHHHDSDRLIWLYDIHLLLEAMTADEQAAFWQLAQARRVTSVCAHSVARVNAWLGVRHDIPAAHPGEPTSLYLDRTRPRAALLAANLAALPTWRARAHRLRQLAFPPPAFMRERFGPHRRAALPWLYLWRAVRGVGRLFGRVGG
jgi:hypothetical protein